MDGMPVGSSDEQNADPSRALSRQGLGVNPAMPPPLSVGGEEHFMKRVITVLMLAMFSASLVACRASAEVEDDDMDGRDTSYKRTTKVESDGDRTIKTEKRTTN